MRSTSLISLIALVALSMFTTGCTTLSDDTTRFFDQNVERQHEEFRALPIERQYELYRAGILAWHPPHTRFAVDLASRGEEAIPYLLAKLEEERWDHMKERIILVLRVMTRIYGVELHKDDAVMLTLENTVASMDDPLYRRQSAYSLRQIAHPESRAD